MCDLIIWIFKQQFLFLFNYRKLTTMRRVWKPPFTRQRSSIRWRMETYSRSKSKNWRWKWHPNWIGKKRTSCLWHRFLLIIICVFWQNFICLRSLRSACYITTNFLRYVLFFTHKKFDMNVFIVFLIFTLFVDNCGFIFEWKIICEKSRDYVPYYFYINR